jgi:hypothetical protein
MCHAMVYVQFVLSLKIIILFVYLYGVVVAYAYVGATVGKQDIQNIQQRAQKIAAVMISVGWPLAVVYIAMLVWFGRRQDF